MPQHDRAAGAEQLAELCWRNYMERRRADPAWLERTGLPPLEEIRERARVRLAE